MPTPMSKISTMSRKGQLAYDPSSGRILLIEENHCGSPWVTPLRDALKGSKEQYATSYDQLVIPEFGSFNFTDVGLRVKKGGRYEVFLFDNPKAKIIFGRGERRLVGGTHATALQWAAMFAMTHDIEELLKEI